MHQGQATIRSRQLAAGFALTCLASLPAGISAVSAQQGAAAPQTGDTAPGILGDDYARESGAIIVTADRYRDGNLFEAVTISPDSCLAKAPRVAATEPGFAIDAKGLTKVAQLERIRRQTRAGTIFVTGGNFAGADFRKARIHDMCFFGSDLSQTDWSGVSAPGLGFISVDLTGAKMQKANLPDVLFRDTKLGLVNAAGASWKQGRLDGGWEGSLEGLDLSGADLTDFRFVCGSSAADGCPTERSGIVMRSANLRRASLHTLHAGDLSLSGARIDQTELALDHLPLLGEAQLAGPVVLRSKRRATMLFPAEVERLAEVAQAASAAGDPCQGLAEADAAGDPDRRARGVICAIPGSEARALVQTVSLLEGAGQEARTRDAQLRRWSAARDACLGQADADEQATCMLGAYRDRLADLRSALGQPGWLAGTGYRLFLSREAAFPTDQGEPGLYGRILPVLLDSAVAAVIVRADGTGKADARGVAIGGCSFEARGMIYDAGSAQLGFASRPRRGKPAALDTPLLSLAASSAQVIDPGLVRAAPACGPGNPFPLMEEIALDERLLADIWERF